MKSCILKFCILLSVFTVMFSGVKIAHAYPNAAPVGRSVFHIIQWQDEKPNQLKAEKPDNSDDQEVEDDTEDDKGFHYDPNDEEGDENLPQSEDDY